MLKIIYYQFYTKASNFVKTMRVSSTKHVFVIISVSSKWTYDLLPIYERIVKQ